MKLCELVSMLLCLIILVALFVTYGVMLIVTYPSQGGSIFVGVLCIVLVPITGGLLAKWAYDEWKNSTETKVEKNDAAEKKQELFGSNIYLQTTTL